MPQLQRSRQNGQSSSLIGAQLDSRCFHYHLHRQCILILIGDIMTMIITGVHKSFHPTIRDGSTWSTFGARGEHGDVFRFSTEVFSGSPTYMHSGSRRTVLQFSENRALVLGEPCSGSQRTTRRTSYPILVQADPLIKRALDKYFKDQ